jgi:TRAP-type C4-dicarboxylate transport system substrate-binding protein
MIDGVSTAYSGIDSYKLQDVAKFIAEGDMGAVTFATVMNQASYNALPADLRRLIDDSSGLASGKLYGKLLGGDEVVLREKMLKEGVKITKLTDVGPLQQAAATIRDRAIKKAATKGQDANKALSRMKTAIEKYQDQHL